MGLALPLACLLALAGSPPEAKEPSYTRLPWHLVDVDYDFGERKDVRTIEVDYQLHDSVRDEGDGKVHGLFVVPFAGNLSGREVYAGACSRGFDTGEKSKFAVLAEPGYAFTQFGTNSPAAVAPAKGGYTLLSDHEGLLAGVRNSTATHDKGRYTLKFSSGRLAPETRGADHRTIVDLTITRHADRSVTAVGGLVFDGAGLTLDSRVTSFCEVIQGWDGKANRWRKREDNGAEQTPNVRYAVGNWRIDGERVTAKTIVAQYRADVPQRAKVYPLKDCPDKELKAATDKALAGEDTLVYVVSKEDHRRTGDTVQLSEFEGVGGRKYDAVREVLKKGGAADTPPPTPTDKPPPAPKDNASAPKLDGSGEAKPVPPGSNGGDAKPYK